MAQHRIRGVHVGWLTVISLAGCGRIGFDAAVDGGAFEADAVDAAPPCTFGPWQPPVRVTPLSSTGDEFGGQVTGDGLAFYFQRSNQVFAARRTDRASPWPAAVDVPSLNPSGNQTIEVAPVPGELEVYLARDEGTGQCTYHASRTVVGGAFSIPARLDALCASGAVAVGPNISSDGLTLYYSLMEGGGVLGRIFETHRATTDETFAAGSPSPGLGGALDKGYPFVTRDGLTMYWEGGPGPGHHLNETHRAAVTDPWGPSTTIAVVDDNNDNEDVSITDDGLELYFSSRRQPSLGGMDVFMSTRSCN
jgi:hypothetical protein